MADLAELGIKVTYRETQPVVRNLKKIEDQGRKTEKATAALSRPISKVQQSMIKQRQQIEKMAQSYKEADAAAQAYWQQIRKSASKVEKDLMDLKKANIAAFDKEDLRLYRKELGSAETQLRRLKGKIPNEEFNRLQHEISESRRALDRHNTATKKHIAVTTTATQVMGKFRAVMASLVGVAAMGYVVKQTLDFADATAKAADRIGVTTDLLQEYRYVADKAGVSSQNLEKGLGAFVARMGELKSGRGQLHSFLKDYDEGFLEALKATNSTEEALEMFLERMAEAKQVSHDTAVALGKQGFGRTAGVEMITMIKDGTEALDELRDRFKRLGIAIDEEALRNAEKANDAIADLVAVLRTQLVTVIGKLAPDIAKLAQSMAEWVAANDELLKQDIPAFLSDVTTGLGKLIDALDRTIVSMQIVTKMFYDPAGAAAMFREELKKVRDEAKKTQEETKKYILEPITVYGDALQEVDEMVRKSPLFTKPDDIKSALDPELFREAQRIIEDTMTPLERLERKLKMIDKVYNAGLISAQTYMRAIQQAGVEAVIQLEDTIQETEEEITQMTADMLSDMRRTLGTMFGDESTEDLDDAILLQAA